MTETPPGRRRRPVRFTHTIPEALRALDAKARPDLKRAIPAVFIALVCFAVGERLGGIDRNTPARFAAFGHAWHVAGGNVTALVGGLTALFALSAVIATRSVGGEISRVISARGNVEAAITIRLICSMIGYLIGGLGVLALLRVDLGNLLVGGAVTGVVVGIAAQQTLGNFFAGLVLLFARPYVPGQYVRIRTGGLGGPFEGTITSSGLMYTVIETTEGPVSLPNSGLLAAAIGPVPVPVPEPEEPAGSGGESR
ncbi:mechanosensitive ion channel family protein [Jatrophihabitans sp.]|uniref:mechanosensitive ion channel family protein n=1 Tax=Jatrophihabitans sp. TaxID=1932789 RepID=UPI0030C6BD99|nr:small-conductance mechanosensitive channel-like protein [Jatrophihabitans sp.]